MVYIAYINLARRTDRRATMEAQLDRLGLSAERIEAVTPGDIPPDLIERHTSRRHVEHVRLTELSCTLSHHKALASFLAGTEQHALILEDDVVLSPAVKSLVATDLTGFDILRLETFFDPQHLFQKGQVTLGPFTSHRIASRCAGTAAYIVNRHAATEILRYEAARSRSYDFVLFFPFRPPGSRLNAMQVIPALAAQDHRLTPDVYASDIQQAADTRALKPAHSRLPHAIAEFWLSDLSINIVKTANRVLRRTRREIVPVSLD